jgi:tRNA(Ile)-lysidine synthase TilS/MesJ
MIHDGERVLVAASGGKDSLTLLKILAQKYDVTAVCIDEGIAGYREHSIVDLQNFCTPNNIPLIIRSYKAEKGTRLDAMALTHPCSTCGVWRRELLADAAKDFDVIATGHNLDDEAQTIMMNVCKHHPMKPKPVLLGRPGFTKRVKPLYFIAEADVKRYAFIHKLVSSFVECPNAAQAHRRHIQHYLENRERTHPGSKERLVRGYLEWLAQRTEQSA